jgi:hypothetical protein
MKRFLMSAAAAVLAMSSSTYAATIFLSDTDTSPVNGVAAPAALTLSPGQTKKVYIYANVPANEQVQAVGVDFFSSNAGLSASNTTVEQPLIFGGAIKRWDDTSTSASNSTGQNPNPAGTFLTGIKPFAVSATGLNPAFVAADPGVTGGFFRIGSFDLTAAANASGLADLKMVTNGLTISYFSGKSGPTFFGTGDAVTGSGGASAGDTSTLPEMVVTLGTVPEPTSLAFLGLGAMGLIRRRKA